MTRTRRRSMPRHLMRPAEPFPEMRIGNVLLRCTEEGGERNVVVDIERPGPADHDIAKAVAWAMQATRWMHGLGARHVCDAWIETGRSGADA